MSTILITGINGFFGRNLVDRWMQQHTLIGVDLPADPIFASYDPLSWHDQINRCDLREDARDIRLLFNGVDTVIHLASKTRIDPSWENYRDYYDTNVAASQTLFKVAQEEGIKKFIYFSSSSVYGNNGTAVQAEDSPLCPSNPYAVSKLAAEWALRVQALKGNTELIIVRPFTMYGHHMAVGTYSLVVTKFLQAFARDEPLRLAAGGDQRRDFIHADDAIDALELILAQGRNGDVFNIGTGQPVTIKQLADCVSSKRIIMPARVGHVDSTCADITKLRALGFEPKINVLEWLTNHVNDLKLNLTITQKE
jgi:nucleoside-diphosphate-sugar epimerase